MSAQKELKCLDGSSGRAEAQAGPARDVATELLDLFTAFQGSRGCDVEQRQQPPAQAAAIQVSLLSSAFETGRAHYI